MGTRGGKRGLRGGGLLRLQHEICGFCVCGVHFVLAAHVVALNCGKLSTQQAGQGRAGWPHVACGMMIGKTQRLLRLFVELCSSVISHSSCQFMPNFGH